MTTNDTRPLLETAIEALQLNKDIYNDAALEIQKAQQIINKEHNYKHDILLITGYTRQSTENVHIPQRIIKICVSFWGSMQSCIVHKLTQMIQKQLLAKQTEAIRISKEVEIETREINERTANIEAELAEAKPALEAAQNAVSNINHKHLISTKCLRRPPRMVEFTLTAVCELLNVAETKQISNERAKQNERHFKATHTLVYGYIRLTFDSLYPQTPKEIIDLIFQIYYRKLKHKGKKSCFPRVKSWKTIQKIIASNRIIPSVLKFDVNLITEKLRKKMKKLYLSNSEFTFERVNKASKFCGPLVLWVKSQIKFAHLLDSVEPMIKETEELKRKLAVKQQQVEQLNSIVKEMKFKHHKIVEKIRDINGEEKYQNAK